MLILRTVLLLCVLVVLNSLHELLLDKPSLQIEHRISILSKTQNELRHATRVQRAEKNTASTYLLLANLAISPRPRLFFERLDPALEDVTESASVSDEVVQLLRDALRRGIVRVVK